MIQTQLNNKRPPTRNLSEYTILTGRLDVSLTKHIRYFAEAKQGGLL
jgi:hypothetical protein